MTAKMMTPAIGTIVGVPFGSLGNVTVAFKVKDVKSSYGNMRLLVEPMSGTGACWIDATRAVEMTATEVKA